MQTVSIRADDIEIGERHRALSNDAVARLAASMKDVGLIQPITVRIVDEMIVDGQMTAGVPVLVAGNHRLAAAKVLGWDKVDCIEVGDDAVRAELLEIAENLHRLDLTKEQRDEHIRRYAVLVGISRQSVAKPEPLKAGRPEGIAAQVARDTGLSKRTIERALAPTPVEPKPVLADHEVTLRQANAIVAAWNRASLDARAIALEQIDGPVFDRTRSA